MRRPPLSEVVRNIPLTVPFVGPEAQERARGRPFVARLGANESLFGPSPKAIRAMEEAAAGSWMYSDPESYDLRQAMARHHGVSAKMSSSAKASTGCLGLTVKMAADPGTPGRDLRRRLPDLRLSTWPRRAARLGQGALPQRQGGSRRAAGCRQREQARILYVSNPNNPMGTLVGRGRNRKPDRAACPMRTLLCLDEAYCDTAPAKNSVPRLDVGNPQVLRFRTFSKAYGLAGARIGYAIGDADVIATFEKIRNHYGINRMGQIGALAALEDQAYLGRSRRPHRSRPRRHFQHRRLEWSDAASTSAANFVTIDCGRDGAFAVRVLEGLLARDVFARKPGVPPLDRCIRVSCGRDEDLGRFCCRSAGGLAGGAARLSRPPA